MLAEIRTPHSRSAGSHSHASVVHLSVQFPAHSDPIFILPFHTQRSRYSALAGPSGKKIKLEKSTSSDDSADKIEDQVVPSPTPLSAKDVYKLGKVQRVIFEALKVRV